MTRNQWHKSPVHRWEPTSQKGIMHIYINNDTNIITDTDITETVTAVDSSVGNCSYDREGAKM